MSEASPSRLQRRFAGSRLALGGTGAAVASPSTSIRARYHQRPCSPITLDYDQRGPAISVSLWLPGLSV